MRREGNSSSSSCEENRPEELELISDAVEKPAYKPVNELCSIAHLFLRDELLMPRSPNLFSPPAD